VEGKGMLGVPGIAARTFGALSAAGHSVSMISQASSEASICFVVPAAEADDAVRALQRAFAKELEGKVIDAVKVERPVSLLAVVGLGMAGLPGIASRTTAPLARDKVNIRAIARGPGAEHHARGQGADAPRALRRCTPSSTREAAAGGRHARPRGLGDLSAPGRSAGPWRASSCGRRRTSPRWASGRRRGRLRPLGLRRAGRASPARRWRRCSSARRRGAAVGGKGRRKLTAAIPESEIQKRGPELVKALAALPLANPVFVDVTAVDDAPLVRQALERGLHVVLANKKPLVAPQADFEALFAAARERGLSLRYEATVGAGLPVLDTLKKLQEAGDRVHVVIGALSGTLGFLMTQLDEGVPFSEAVRTAHRLGYTEPDPKDDLSGMDVGAQGADPGAHHRDEGRAVRRRRRAAVPGVPGEAPAAEFLERVGDWTRSSRAGGREQAPEEVLRYVARIEKRGSRSARASARARPPAAQGSGQPGRALHRPYNQPAGRHRPGAARRSPPRACSTTSWPSPRRRARGSDERPGDRGGEAFAPATVGNVGPGFDVLGLAVEAWATA
jgi:aspartokinase/homoserine dehydrogenase 1